MKARNSRLILGSIATVAGLFLTGGSAIAQIATTAHNLSANGTGSNQFSGTQQICVFCHTPHGADVSASVPLWNRALAAPASYTTYDSLGTTSLDGATAPVGSVSLACMSCHDGTQAMDSVLNEPGSGAVVASFNAGTWTGPAGGTTPVGSISNTIVNLGQDLSNDHPIGIQYGGGGITSVAPAAATNDPDFLAPNSEVINGNTIWWVETNNDATRQKSDLQLYTRADATAAGGTAIAGGAQPYVECASCHDPHIANATFLRVANDGSAVCLACHDK